MTVRVPAYALYGETLRGRFPDELHIETIVVRSSVHDWTIRLHRHQDLFQFFLIVQGGGIALVEGVEHRLAASNLIVLPPMAVHGFNFDPGTAGFVASVPAATMDVAFNPERTLRQSLSHPTVRAVESSDIRGLARIMECALDEFAGREEGRGEALQKLVTLIALGFARLLCSGAGIEARSGPGKTLVARFVRLVETDFRVRVPLAAYARQLGVSVPHLTRVCREILGRPALTIIHDRIMLEARRNLVYTAMPIAEISEALGFSDPAYFSRFFVARGGMRPTAFRAREQDRA